MLARSALRTLLRSANSGHAALASCPGENRNDSQVLSARSCASNSSVVYQPIPDSRLDEITDLFISYFFAGEPTTAVLRGCQGAEPEAQRAWLRPSLDEWDRSVCLMAVDTNTDQVIGASLNTIITPENHNPMWRAVEYKENEMVQWLIKFLHELEGGFDIFKEYNVNRVLYRIMATVDDRYKGQRIASEMFRRTTTELAPAAGCQAAMVAATSRYTQLGLSKLGFQTVKAIPYRGSLLEQNPRANTENAADHHSAALMAIKFNNPRDGSRGEPSRPRPDPGGRAPDGRNPDGRNPDGRNLDGRNPDGRNPDGRGPDGRNPNGRNPDDRSSDCRNPDGRNPDGRSPDGRNPDGRGPDGRNPDGHGPDGRDPDGRSRDGFGRRGPNPPSASPSSR